MLDSSKGVACTKCEYAQYKPFPAIGLTLGSAQNRSTERLDHRGAITQGKALHIAGQGQGGVVATLDASSSAVISDLASELGLGGGEVAISQGSGYACIKRDDRRRSVYG